MNDETILVNITGVWESLDFNCDVQIGIDRAQYDIQCLNGFISDSALGINIPLNPRNNKTLTWPARLGVCTSPIIEGPVRACYQCNQITYLDGEMKLDGISSRWDHSCASLDVSMFASSWRTELEDCTLSEIDAGSHVYNDANIVLSWDRANQDALGVSYYPVSYGDFDGLDRATPNAFDELRPHVYFDNILNGIFAQTTYKLCDTGFLSSDPWRGLTWMYSGFTFGIDPDLIPINLVSASSGSVGFNQVMNPVFQVEVNDPGNNIDLGVYTAPFTTTYDIVGEIRVDVPAGEQGFLTRLKNGNVDIQYAPFPLTGGVFHTINIDSTECISAGDTIEWRLAISGGNFLGPIGQGGEVTITPTVTPCVNALINNAGLLPAEIECLDFIEAIRIMFGLIFVTDENTKTVCPVPINEFYDSLNTEDWTDRVDLCELIDHKFLFGDVPRCHKFFWTRDEKDLYVERIEEIQNIEKGMLYSYEKCLSKNYQGEKDHNPIFSPTLQYDETRNANTEIVSMPRLWQEFQTTSVPDLSHNFANHFAYFAGTITAADGVGRLPVWDAPDGSAGLPFAYQQRFIYGDEFNLAFDNAGTNRLGLVDTYYSFIFNALTSGRIVEGKGVITKKQFLTLDFASIKVIDNNQFVLLELQGWNPKDGETVLILLHLC